MCKATTVMRKGQCAACSFIILQCKDRDYRNLFNISVQQLMCVCVCVPWCVFGAGTGGMREEVEEVGWGEGREYFYEIITYDIQCK